VTPHVHSLKAPAKTASKDKSEKWKKNAKGPTETTAGPRTPPLRRGSSDPGTPPVLGIGESLELETFELNDDFGSGDGGGGGSGGGGNDNDSCDIEAVHPSASTRSDFSQRASDEM
jgi:hypothetical protein